MKKNWVIIVVLVVAVAAVVWVKGNKQATQVDAPATEAVVAQGMPKLLDLGADKCVPCKMMEPILHELSETYAGTLQVEFIDVWKNQNAGQVYGIRMIPTQIFFDADGQELFRHEGFISKEDILAKWSELGVKL